MPCSCPIGERIDALKQNRLYEMLSCDPDYMDAYGLELVAGRGFSEDYGDDVIN